MLPVIKPLKVERIEHPDGRVDVKVTLPHPDDMRKMIKEQQNPTRIETTSYSDGRKDVAIRINDSPQ